MDFALVPQEGGLPRLWRFVDDPEMTSLKMVSNLDAAQNLLALLAARGTGAAGHPPLRHPPGDQRRVVTGHGCTAQRQR